MKPINIHSEDQVIYLKAGKYTILVLGGWNIFDRGNFSIDVVNLGTDELCLVSDANWPVQLYKYGKRARRMSTVNILNEGKHRILFNHPKDLQIKSSRLLTSLFMPCINNKEIEILFSKR